MIAPEPKSASPADVSNEDVRPDPPSEPVPKSHVPIRDTKEDTGSPPVGVGDGAELGTATLVRLIGFRPFMTYFCWLAHRQNPNGHRPETRVKNLRNDHKLLYGVCVFLDLVVIFVAVVLLLLTGAAVLYKTIWL